MPSDLRLGGEWPRGLKSIGVEVPGGWNGEYLAAVTVLQMFLGGGGSFSTGGPGAESGRREACVARQRHAHQAVYGGPEQAGPQS